MTETSNGIDLRRGLNEMNLGRPEDFEPEFRKGTADSNIWNSVVKHREYGEFVFKDSDIVLDIGMHIGAFSYLALSLGAGEVWGFEASNENYKEAVKNLSSFGLRAKVFRMAVARSTQTPDLLFFSGWRAFPDGRQNTGGGNVLWKTSGEAVPAVGLDTILEYATQQGRMEIRLLKIDAEGSEYPILLTSRCLLLVREIVGEFHEFGMVREPGKPWETWARKDIPEACRIEGIEAFSMALLKSRLEQSGFAVEFTRCQADPRLGQFRARRTLW